MHKKPKMQFIRYGNLKPQKHELNSWIHTAPVEYGVYAFPLYYVEQFLLGGVGSGNISNGRYTFLKDPSTGKKLMIKLSDFYNTNDIGSSYDKTDIKEPWKSYLRSIGLKYTDVFPYIEDKDGLFEGIMPSVSESVDKLYPISVESKPVKFEYSGDIWHHFYEYVKNPGDIIHISKNGQWVLTDIQTYRECLKRFVYNVKYNGYIMFKLTGSPSGFPISHISKDLCEVFIENPKQ